MTNMLKMHQEALEAVLNRESDSQSRHDAKVKELEAKLLAKMQIISSMEVTLGSAASLAEFQAAKIGNLEQALRGYRNDHASEGCTTDSRCKYCKAADAVLEGK